jgi:hypothetical protein
MKKFIIKVLILTAIPVFLYASLFYFLKFSFANNISKHPIILLGDSQTEFIKNPLIYNRSVKGAPYFVQFKFAEEFIENLKDKKIYIAFNYYDFSKLYQNRLLNDTLLKGWTASMFKTIDENHLFNQKNLEIRPDYLSYTFFDIKKVPNLFKKVYFNTERENSSNNILNDTLSVTNAIKRHWYNKDYIVEDSIQLIYFNKLITLLKNNNCEIVLLKMPLTNYYIENVPDKVKDQLPQLSARHHIRILDLNKELAISRDYKYFKDYGHLTKSGDSLVTDYFIKNEIKTLPNKVVEDL